MEKIKRSIRLFLIDYGKLFLYIIGVLFAIIFIVQTLNNMVIQQNILKNNLNSSTEEIVLTEEQKEEENKRITYISNFINYCNHREIEKAYNMISDNCKTEKYNTIEEFEENYVKKIFNIYICNYKIVKNNDIYEVTLIQDVLATGKQDSKILEKYKIDWVVEKKIYILDK